MPPKHRHHFDSLWVFFISYKTIFMFFAGQLSEGARGQLAGVRRAAEAGGAESG